VVKIVARSDRRSRVAAPESKNFNTIPHRFDCRYCDICVQLDEQMAGFHKGVVRRHVRELIREPLPKQTLPQLKAALGVPERVLKELVCHTCNHRVRVRVRVRVQGLGFNTTRVIRDCTGTWWDVPVPTSRHDLPNPNPNPHLTRQCALVSSRDVGQRGQQRGEERGARTPSVHTEHHHTLLTHTVVVHVPTAEWSLCVPNPSVRRLPSRPSH
jgi:hypothetical protein